MRQKNRRWLAGGRLFIISSVTAFLVALGGGSWAYWTATVSASGVLTTQKVEVAQENFSNLAASYTSTARTNTGVFTVMNRGQVKGVASANISAPEELAKDFSIRVWPVNAANACTAAVNIPSSALSGTWYAPPKLEANLDAGASVIYCVRTTIVDWNKITAPGQKIEPQIKLTITSEDGWVATANPAKNTQTTQGRYPLITKPLGVGLYTISSKGNETFCLDVRKGLTENAPIISWKCNGATNQAWGFTPVSALDLSLLFMKPKHATDRNLTYTEKGDLGGLKLGEMFIEKANQNSEKQKWYVREGPGFHQIESAKTGLCIGLSSNGGNDENYMSTVSCGDALAQLVIKKANITFSQSYDTLRFTFGDSTFDTAVRLQRWDGSAWLDTGSFADGMPYLEYAYTTSDASLGSYLPADTSSFRVIASSGEILWDGIELNRAGVEVTLKSDGMG
ncbi:ricin-type beta-trefoil lectin domain protein [Lysinibacter sp. HNR]|uniref:RICIN domain-containing protein n=1 Tax=Lysinibacter sp. HNR TaxID=3031408 RepID=UPI0024347E24|nr:ricin-type beta-trefoil lectin domain protein [Lysinibacter sp. HNR]WGD37849.1 ricin-type beta-trefoil lectin domain protein [Lysinibacter sp. HNR]